MVLRLNPIMYTNVRAEKIRYIYDDCGYLLDPDWDPTLVALCPDTYYYIKDKLNLFPLYETLIKFRLCDCIISLQRNN